MKQKEFVNSEETKKAAIEGLSNTKGFLLITEEKGGISMIGGLSSLTKIEIFGLLTAAKIMIEDKIKEIL